MSPRPIGRAELEGFVAFSADDAENERFRADVERALREKETKLRWCLIANDGETTVGHGRSSGTGRAIPSSSTCSTSTGHGPTGAPSDRRRAVRDGRLPVRPVGGTRSPSSRTGPSAGVSRSCERGSGARAMRPSTSACSGNPPRSRLVAACLRHRRRSPRADRRRRERRCARDRPTWASFPSSEGVGTSTTSSRRRSSRWPLPEQR
jgi:hypothetical protein